MLGEQPDCCMYDPNFAQLLNLNVNRPEAVTMVSIRANGFGSDALPAPRISQH
jgi:hypothetical protein